MGFAPFDSARGPLKWLLQSQSGVRDVPHRNRTDAGGQVIEYHYVAHLIFEQRTARIAADKPALFEIKRFIPPSTMQAATVDQSRLSPTPQRSILLGATLVEGIAH
jgi:hypothetical protein